MTVLRRIRLQNARRFTDAVIELSEGVTILWAQNGTGKTTVFEAIELALCGKIRRLDGGLAPFVRHRCQNASVQLVFSDTTINVGLRVDASTATLAGDLAAVVGADTPADDLPYLLRLTHLLDQSDHEWLLRAPLDGAGTRFSLLPLGRDASRVKTSLNGVKNNLSRRISSSSEALDRALQRLDEWKAAEADRDRHSTAADAPGWGVLAKRLAGFGGLLGSQFDDPSPNPESVRGAIASIKVLLDARERELSRRSALLQALRPRIALQVEVESAGQEAQRVENVVQVRLRETEDAVQVAEGLLRLARDVRDSRQNELSEARRLEAAVARVRQARAELSSAETLHNQRKVAVETARAELGRAVDAETRVSDISTLWDSLSSDELDFAQAREEVTSGAEALDSWRRAETKRSEGGRSRAAAQAQLERVEESVRRAEEVAAARTALTASLLSALEAATSAAGELKRAVGRVVARLDGRDTCPVCLYVHGEEELRQRGATALEQIDPSVSGLADQLTQAKHQQHQAESELQSLLEQRATLRARLGALAREVEEAERLVSAARAHTLLAGVELRDAEQRLQGRRIQLDDLEEGLKERRKSIAPRPSKDAIDAARKAVLDAREGVVRAEEGLLRAAEQKADAAERLTMAQRGFEAEAVPEATHASARVEGAEAALNEARALLAAREQELASRQEQVAAERREVAHAREAVLRVTEELVGIRSAWTDALLEGTPGSTALNDALMAVEAEAEVVRARRRELDQVDALAAGREAQDLLNRAQARVDHLRGEAAEEEFTLALAKSVATAREALQVAERTRTAIGDLATELDGRLADLGQRVVSPLIPRWQGLMRRVLRDGRLSGAGFHYGSSYNKPIAEVRVPLHLADARADEVASAAQMTDLQLTFMLSMAATAGWSPWRALLLDDPTQHHDIVRASAVFDLLRDYAADLGFQVVLATHDALQARFFMRKLRNDGVPARLVELRSTEAGVVATRGS